MSIGSAEVHEATPKECAQIAKHDLERAIRAIDADEMDHARMYVGSATIWLRGA